MLRNLFRWARPADRPSSSARTSPAAFREALKRKDFSKAAGLLEQWRKGHPDDALGALCMAGELAFHRHDDPAAESAFRQALELRPGHAEAHYGLSLLLMEQGEAERAVEHAQYAVSAVPGEARFRAQLGFCHLQLANVMAAEGPLKVAVRLDPESPAAWNNLGLVHRIKGDLSGARQCFLAALAADPNFARAAEHLGQVEAETRHLQQDITGSGADPASDEIRALEAKLVDQVDDLAAAQRLVLLYEKVGDLPSAMSVIEVLDLHRPGDPAVTLERGILQSKLHDWMAAIASLERGLSAYPDHVDGRLALARSLSAIERHRDAQAHLDHADRLCPGDMQILGLRAAGLTNLCRYDEALELCSLLEAAGTLPSCKGIALIFSGRTDAAIEWLSQMLDSHPNDPNMRLNRAQLLLSRHDFAAGWADYAFRRQSDSKDIRVLPLPIWKGEDLRGRRILLLAEQGLGDQLMFASCLPDLLALEPTQVHLEVSHRIAPLVARSYPTIQVIATRQNRDLDWVKTCGDLDVYAALGDLPRQFRAHPGDFPRHTGYLRACPSKTAAWIARLQSLPRPWIGVSWRGGTEGTRTSLRSIAPPHFATLADQVAGSWISLQYGKVDDELRELREAGMDVHHWPEALADLDEFAALLCGLDDIVTVCNTTVHFAGGLGRHVDILAPRIPEWRYGLAGETLPWYPSSRIWRQAVDGDWATVLDAVSRALTDKNGQSEPRTET